MSRCHRCTRDSEDLGACSTCGAWLCHACGTGSDSAFRCADRDACMQQAGGGERYVVTFRRTVVQECDVFVESRCDGGALDAAEQQRVFQPGTCDWRDVREIEVACTVAAIT